MKVERLEEEKENEKEGLEEKENEKREIRRRKGK